MKSQDQLVEHLSKIGDCLVAFSGGVDSAVVAKAAHLALRNRAVAVTGVSASLATGELQCAKRIAGAIGIRHETVPTDEFAQHGYLANGPDRCWHCKSELYRQMRGLGEQLGIRSIVNGANADDLGDYRPGMTAANEQGVRSPLVECGFGKKLVREIARVWQLEVWDKPATPCLSSRVAYGLEVTSERLARIDAAEQWLREKGLREVRVRHHHDNLARIEVTSDDLPRLCEPATRNHLVAKLQELGFQYITIDLEGFRSGSFQQLVPAEELLRF